MRKILHFLCTEVLKMTKKVRYLSAVYEHHEITEHNIRWKKDRADSGPKIKRKPS